MKYVCLLLAVLTCAVGCGDEDVPTAPPAPSEVTTPTGLHFADVGEDYLILAWDLEPTLKPSIRVEGRLVGETEFCHYDDLPRESVRYEVPCVDATAYEFRIAAGYEGEISAWTEPLVGETLPAGYWDVTGGVKLEPDDEVSVFFEFGTANRFGSNGALLIEGPAGWNSGQSYRVSRFEDFAVELDNLGARSGLYRVSFTSVSGRFFQAEVVLDVTLTIPRPVIQMESHLPGWFDWECPEADRAELCFGTLPDPDCSEVAVQGSMDEPAAAPPVPWVVSVTGIRDPTDPQSDDPRDRQAARSVWARYELR